MLSTCISTSDAVAWRLGAAHSRNRGMGTPNPPLMAGRIEDALSGRNLRGNVGLERRSRSGCIDGVEGGQWMSGSVAIHPAERPTVRLSGRCANRRNVETACGVDSQWSAYPWLGNQLPEARETSRSKAYLDTSGIPGRGTCSLSEGYVCLRGAPFPRIPCSRYGHGKQQRSNSTRSERKKRQ